MRPAEQKTVRFRKQKKRCSPSFLSHEKETRPSIPGLRRSSLKILKSSEIWGEKAEKKVGGKKKLREKERKEMEMKGGKEKNIKVAEKERKGMLKIERKWEDCNQNMEFDRQLIGKKG